MAFCAASASARICERVAVPQPQDEVAQKIFRVARSSDFLGPIRWRFLRWKKRSPNELQMKFRISQRNLFSLLKSRDSQLAVVVKEDLKADIRQLESRMQLRNEAPTDLLDEISVGPRWTQDRNERKHLAELKARWNLAPLFSERAAMLNELDIAIRREAQVLSEIRLELLKSSKLWGEEIIGAQLIHRANEAAYIEIEDSEGRFFTWQPQEFYARLATVIDE